MSKKEPNAWDRFWLMVKQNEKVIWVLLLLILAPSFAFTGYISTWMGSAARKTSVANLYGKDVSKAQYDYSAMEIRLVREVAPQFLYGSYDYENPLFGMNPRQILDFRIHLAEADRMGIRISDFELGSQIRRVYQSLVAEDDAQAAYINFLRDSQKDARRAASPQMAMNQYRQTKYQRMSELERQDFFDQADWYDRLQKWHSPNWGQPIPREELENAIRDAMKVRKLRDYIELSVQVTPQEALEEFKKKEQTRKFSFFEVNAASAKEEVEKSITEADIKARYEKRKDDFREDLKLRVAYLSVPLAEFEKKATVTDEDVRKRYDDVKVRRYQTFVATEAGGFDLLPPEEKAEREKKAFRPYEEVKEELRAEVMKERVRSAALAAAEEIQGKVYPKKPGAIGEKKDDKPEPTPATFEEIAKQFPMVKTGTTAWVDRKSAEKSVPPEAWTATISSWFSQLEPGPSGKAAKREVEAPQNYTAAFPTASTEAQYWVFYQKPEVRQPGVPPLAEATEKVKEKLVKEKLFERAKEKAKALTDELRGGKKSLEDAAKDAGTTVTVTAFVDRKDTIKVPLSPEELKKAEAEKADAKKDAKKEPGAEDVKEPTEKDFPASKVVLEYGFDTLREKGKVEGFAEDPESSACYIVRWDNTIFPDLKQFDRSRAEYESTLLREKQILYLADWWTKVRKEANPQRYGASPTAGQANIPDDF